MDRGDIETVRNWVAVIALIISASSVILVWVKAPGQKIAGAIDKVTSALDAHKTSISDDMKKHDRRIQAVEDEIKHLPTSDEFNDLQVAVKGVEGDVKRVEELLGRVGRTTDRIDDFLRASK